MLANFIITSDSLFSEQNTIYENWVQGYKYVKNQLPVADIRSVYDLKVVDQAGMKLLVSGKACSPEFAVQTGKDMLKVKATRSVSRLLFIHRYALWKWEPYEPPDIYGNRWHQP